MRVFSMKDAGVELRDLQSKLPAECEPFCVACGAPLDGTSVVSADADQAYEQCSASAATGAWPELAPKL